MKSLFGRLKKDGTFDRRVKGNKHGWAGKLPVEEVVYGAMDLGSKVKNEVSNTIIDTMVNEDTLKMINDRNWAIFQRRPNQYINEKILSLPSDISNEERFDELVNYVDTNYLNKSKGSMVQTFFEQIKDNTVKELEIKFDSLNDSFWITNSLYQVSKDLMWSKKSPLYKLKNSKSNNQLKRKIAKYYNDKVDENFFQIRDILNDAKINNTINNISTIGGENYIYKFNKYEKVRFKFYFQNTPLKNKLSVLINRIRS